MRRGTKIILLSFFIILFFTKGVLAYSIDNIDYTEHWIDEVVDYMNSKGKDLSLGEKQYEIYLSDGSKVYSNVKVSEAYANPLEVKLLSYFLGDSGSDTSNAQPGKTYNFEWTVNRTGALGGSFTIHSSYSTDLNRVNGNLYLRGESSEISAVPPRAYGIVDKDSYFSKSFGRTISTKSYVKLGMDLTAKVVRYSSYFDVDFTGNYDTVTVNYSHSLL